MSGIRISEKHGVNASMGVCFFCGEDDGTIALPGRLKGDVEAPRRAVWSMEPCAKCADLMKQGVMLIEATGTGDNPHRTGQIWVMSEAWVKRCVTPESMASTMLRKRCAFIDPAIANAFGLPRGEKGAK